jgi:DNA-binding CsgD family transcriptional regulator
MSGGGASLLERSTELDQIAGAVERTAAGTGGVLLIEGAAGIGKTELLRAAREIAASSEVTVLTARASELEREYSYGVARQLLQRPLMEMDADERRQALSGAAALAGSLLDEQGSPESGDTFALLHGLHWLVANLALTQPLMLAVDDVQWSDHESLHFLHYLAGRIEDLPVIVIATLRTGEPDAPAELLARLRAENATETIRPAVLSLDATVTVVRDSVGAEAEPGFCAACHHASGGNPLLLSELIRGLALEGVEPVETQASRVTEVGARGVAQGLRSRIDRLAADARDVARAVAVLEPHATLRRVAALAELGQDAASSAAHALVEAGVLSDGSPLEFAHPLLRAAVEGEMSEPQRRALHGSAAQVHHDDGSDPGVIAAHLVKTDTVGGEWVVDDLGAAAEQALSRGAADPAVLYLRRALEEHVGEAQRLALRMQLGLALLRGGDADGLEVLLEVRNATTDVAERAKIVHLLSPSLHARGDLTQFEKLAQDTLDELGSDHFDVRLLTLSDLARSAVANNPRAFSHVAELARLAPDLAGSTIPERLALDIASLSGVVGLQPAEDARTWALRAVGDEDALRAIGSSGFPLYTSAFALAATGDPNTGRRVAELGVEATRRRGAVFGVAIGLATQVGACLAQGDIQAAEMYVEEARPSAAQTVPVVGMGLAGQRIWLALQRGRLDAANSILIDEGLTGELPDYMYTLVLRVARAHVRLAQRRPDEALADLTHVARSYEGIGSYGPDLLPARLAVPLALAAGERTEEAVEWARESITWAEAAENPRLLAEALRVGGLVDPDAGTEALQNAVALLAPSQYRLNHAEALVDLGSALRRANERRAARDPLREGMELAHRCGATGLEERARTELEATGARPRSIVVSGADSLTPSERRVAQLAIEGMTNREIAQTLYVTPKTVETHLRHCYQKLEIAGRRDLSAALSEESDQVNLVD